MGQNSYSAYISAVLTTPAKHMKTKKSSRRKKLPESRQTGTPRRKTKKKSKISEPEKLARFISRTLRQSVTVFYPALVWVRGSQKYRAMALEIESFKKGRRLVRCTRAYYITDEGTIGNLVPKRKRRSPWQQKPKKSNGEKNPATIDLRCTGKWTT